MKKDRKITFFYRWRLWREVHC